MAEQQGFDWPKVDLSDQQLSHQQVLSTVKNAISTLLNKTDQTPTATSLITNTTIEPAPAVTEAVVTETTTQTILTTITDALGVTVKDLVTQPATENNANLEETVSSNSTVLSSNTTTLTEVFKSNSTVSEVAFKTTTESVSGIVTETMKTITDTTENILGISSNATSMSDSTSHMEHDDLILYIVSGVLLGLLIIIFVALFIFYRRYKQCRQNSGDYCVTQLKEVSSSDSIRTTSDLNDMNVKH